MSNYNHKLLPRICVAAALAIFGMLDPLAAAQQSPGTSQTSNAQMASPAAVGVNQEAASPALRIGNGDLLHVSVFGAPEYDKEVRVSNMGEVSLPMLGLIKVSDLPPNEAENTVAAKLKDGGYFSDPQVSILIKEYATQGVSILGEVQKPGIYPLLGSRRLFDAISAAGGTTPKAGRTASITHRDRPNDIEIVDLSQDAKSEPQNNNVEISPGDTISVSKAGLVYVVGDVRTPSGFLMENSQLTVLQAIAMAQGTNPTASLDHTRLIRRTTGEPQEISVPLKKIMAAKSPDIQLQADDIVFVPVSAGKSAARTGIDTILRTLSGVVIYSGRRF